MTSSNPQKGELWLAYVEFAGHKGVGKVRPAVVLSIENEGESFIVAKVTASANWEHSEYIAIPNWKECGLKKPSFIQLDPLFELNKSQILRDSPLGTISKQLLEAIVNKINLGN